MAGLSFCLSCDKAMIERSQKIIKSATLSKIRMKRPGEVSVFGSVLGPYLDLKIWQGGQDDEIWQGGFWKRQSMAMEPSRPDDGQMFLGQSVVDFRSPHRQNGPLNPRSSSFSHACCAQLVGFSHEQEV